jgi:hypothetical protein
MDDLELDPELEFQQVDFADQLMEVRARAGAQRSDPIGGTIVGVIKTVIPHNLVSPAVRARSRESLRLASSFQNDKKS